MRTNNTHAGVSSDAADRVRLNAGALYETAKRLHRTRHFAHSVHFSILAGEECAKFLLVYCKSHLPPEVYRRRYQHIHKSRVLRAPWFIAGQLSVLYSVALVERVYGAGQSIAETIGILHRLVAHLVGRGEPEKVAEAILQSLAAKPDPFQQKMIDEYAAQREQDRLSSVYVDVADDLSVANHPSQIDRKKSNDHLDEAALAISVIEYIHSPSETIFDFVERLPVKEKRTFRKEGTRGLRAFERHVLRNKRGGG